MPLPIGDVGYKGRNRFLFSFTLGPFEFVATSDCTTIKSKTQKTQILA